MLNVRALTETDLIDEMALLKISSQALSLENEEDKTVDTSETQQMIVEQMTVDDQKSVEDLKEKTPLNQSHLAQQLKIISLDEIAWHDTAQDCWFAIYDYVYDCTQFFDIHPGGRDVLLEYAGRDATLAFIGTGHSKFATKMLEKYLIGELPKNERIFRIPGGLQVSGF